MAHEREVAGIRCTEVLALLADYIDGDLPDHRRRQIDEHLAGCSWCEDFGGAYGALVTGLRELGAPAPTPPLDPAPPKVE